MKTLKISNGEVRLGYELSELSDKAKQVVIQEHWIFLCNVDEDSDTLTEEDVVDSIEANNYLFDEDGDMLSLRYHYKDNKLVKVLYKDKYKVEII